MLMEEKSAKTTDGLRARAQSAECPIKGRIREESGKAGRRLLDDAAEASR